MEDRQEIEPIEGASAVDDSEVVTLRSKVLSLYQLNKKLLMEVATLRQMQANSPAVDITLDTLTPKSTYKKPPKNTAPNNNTEPDNNTEMDRNKQRSESCGKPEEMDMEVFCSNCLEKETEKGSEKGTQKGSEKETEKGTEKETEKGNLSVVECKGMLSGMVGRLDAFWGDGVSGALNRIQAIDGRILEVLPRHQMSRKERRVRKGPKVEELLMALYDVKVEVDEIKGFLVEDCAGLRKTLKTDIQHASQGVEKWSANFQMESTGFDRANERIIELEGLLEQVEHERNTAQCGKDACLAELEDLRVNFDRELSSAEKTLTIAKDQYEEICVERDALLCRLEGVESLEQERDFAFAEVSDLKCQIEELETLLEGKGEQELVEHQTQDTKREDELEKLVAKLEQERACLVDEREETQAEFLDMKDSIKDMASEIKKLNTECTGYQKEVENLTTEKQRLESEIGDLMRPGEYSKDKESLLEQFEMENKELGAQCGVYKKEIDALTEERQRLESEIEDLIRSVADSKDKESLLEQLELENRELIKKVTNLNQDMERAVRESDTVTKEKDRVVNAFQLEVDVLKGKLEAGGEDRAGVGLDVNAQFNEYVRLNEGLQEQLKVVTEKVDATKRVSESQVWEKDNVIVELEAELMRFKDQMVCVKQLQADEARRAEKLQQEFELENRKLQDQARQLKGKMERVECESVGKLAEQEQLIGELKREVGVLNGELGKVRKVEGRWGDLEDGGVRVSKEGEASMSRSLDAWTSEIVPRGHAISSQLEQNFQSELNKTRQALDTTLHSRKCLEDRINALQSELHQRRKLVQNKEHSISSILQDCETFERSQAGGSRVVVGDDLKIEGVSMTDRGLNGVVREEAGEKLGEEGEEAERKLGRRIKGGKWKIMTAVGVSGLVFVKWLFH